MHYYLLRSSCWRYLSVCVCVCVTVVAMLCVCLCLLCVCVCVCVCPVVYGMATALPETHLFSLVDLKWHTPHF